MSMNWFELWFDSRWYHQLYQHHNEQEAALFIDRLITYLHPDSGATFLDLACGRGRHALHISNLGFEVTGLDISASNIDFARRMESERLSFFQHDMRNPFRINYYDYVLNLFTSFGYFDKDSIHLNVLKHVYRNLKPGGIFVLDYMNANKVRHCLVTEEIKEVDDITFRLNRSLDDKHVYKRIDFIAEGKEHTFTEKVRTFSQSELTEMMVLVGFEVIDILGNYQLEAFHETNSQRLILIARK